ncbi:LysR family transcriptional regulator [Bradyrhizobium sp. U87765 SZCCT0131]|uniref:LysR family transcriptional regulator n=1 Tax=unclassified Bradyrhizobium TaxID=2631580 RepID=UPI001BAA3E78|nr:MULTISPECIES: LysR family transcriptional regulator [unclassified Bradyrhizobium]MBR1220765.1 LysR family transcriptional regulator [Bradyrhizobium sp. U87765 SZCCT0131]MBR1260415.1 LysR family transcriptional regulator [Bradyrhizobium sp. U87765 SZCCT0134]MBR1307336.1 LysR family transcriptional regulator [Bradyrhizobium sp. U87765 SZCCT0110]MBR1321290.1 LysR family transcriptional regulator [Bradyrhizobium sp. U87765 SZCCT0109]MBR1349603.1 LysR family transcriptional regulator [Bradyrhizo
MDRLASMAVFVKAVDLGSFAAAAVALDLSGPMVGKHVRFLEERLGVRLLNRTTRRQSLTEFGRAYYERCRVVLAEAEAADALAADQFAEPRGRLRVALPVLFGRRCVAPVLLALARQHPALELELAFSDPLLDLAESGCDLAIRTGALQDMAGVVTRRLARQHMIVCAAPSYLAGHGTPQQLVELAQHTAILYGRAGRAAPWRFPQDGAPPLEITPPSRLRLDDLEAIADAATAGFGLAWLPSWLVRERLQSGALVRLLPDTPEFPYDCHALWLQTPHLPRKIRIAIDALAAALPGQMD